jgi:hypothetical protein
MLLLFGFFNAPLTIRDDGGGEGEAVSAAGNDRQKPVNQYSREKQPQFPDHFSAPFGWFINWISRLHPQCGLHTTSSPAPGGDFNSPSRKIGPRIDGIRATIHQRSSGCIIFPHCLQAHVVIGGMGLFS